MERREFLKRTGTVAGALYLPRELVLGTGPAAARGSVYGLLECAHAPILAALARSRAGILACTVNDQTHCCDAGRSWGTDDAVNDLYFGLHGGLFVSGEDQHRIFRNELRKIGRYVSVAPNRPPVPWSVSADGRTPKFNPDGGYDLDRCAQFVLEVVRTYEVTGDRQFASDLYPKCADTVEYLIKRDADGDLLPEGRPSVPIPVGPGGCACSSVSYIGDTSANTWKDFGAALFLYEALRRLSVLETVLGKQTEAARHSACAERLGAAARKLLWNSKSDGFLAWVDKDGTAHEDWITGNNLHAVACGLADRDQSARILKKLTDNRDELEEVIPCRVRLGLFAEGLCSNRPNYYWNGGIWTLVAAPDMLARAAMNNVEGALHVADLLATHPKVTEVGFFEAYDGKTGEPNDCRGLLMNNGGFIWGFFEAVLGVDVRGDVLRFRSSVPAQITPAKARLHYRGADFEVAWQTGRRSSATIDRTSLILDQHGYYSVPLKPESGRTYRVEIVQAAA
jgi:hypothetical protein